MRYRILPLFLSAILLTACSPKQVDYLKETKADKDARMAWWRDARFGMFIHWGLYAVPAGEWKGQTNHAEWIRETAKIPLEEYNQFVGQFNPVKFNADDWVSMAKDAGMKYIVITSKHHDGFGLFNSRQTDFDVMSTPFKRDILKELSKACQKQDMTFCFYHSIMDWHHPDYLPRRSWETTRSTEGADFDRYRAYMKAQLKELLTGYGKIGVLWFDGEWENTWTSEYGKDLYNWVRNLQPGIIINNRVTVGRSGMAGMTEGEELQAGTDPLAASSVLRMGTMTGDGSHFTVTWSSVSGKSYVLQSATNVSGPYNDRPETQTNASGSIIRLDFTDNLASGFYRLRVIP